MRVKKILLCLRALDDEHIHASFPDYPMLHIVGTEDQLREDLVQTLREYLEINNVCTPLLWPVSYTGPFTNGMRVIKIGH